MQALIIIDIQNDYFPGGKMELCGSEAAAHNAALLLKAFRKAGKPVFHVQHISLAPTATFFLPGTAGALIHGSVAPLAGETVVEKHFPNSFRDTPLLALLQAQVGRGGRPLRKRMHGLPGRAGLVAVTARLRPQDARV